MAPFFAWPVLWITLPALVWLIDGALSARKAARATRWRQRRRDRRRRGRLVVRLRLFPVRPVLDRRGVPRRGRDLRRPAAASPSRCCRRPGAVLRGGGGIAARFWTAGTEPRPGAGAGAVGDGMAARPCASPAFPGTCWATRSPIRCPLMQSAAVLGIYGLTLVRGPHLRAAAGAVERGGGRHRPAGRARHRGARRRRAAARCLPLCSARSGWRWRRRRRCRASRSGSCSRACRSGRSGARRTRQRIFLDHLALSAANAAGEVDNLAGITHVVWPEAAMPFLPLDHPDVRAAIGRLLPPGTFLITGALRAEPAPPGSPRPRRIFNSLLVFGEGGSLTTLLRQDPSGAVRRIPAVAAAARGDRPAAAHPPARRLRQSAWRRARCCTCRACRRRRR